MAQVKHRLNEIDVCEAFIVRMQQAMQVSLHKYGRVVDAYPHKVDAIATLEDRLKKYKKTRNTDYLVDIANFAMIEFAVPSDDACHDSPTDGGEGRKWANGTVSEKRNDGERF